MASNAATPRAKHPYWMYDAMQSQPDHLGRLLDDGWQQAKEAAQVLQHCRRLFLVGIGSSYHVALTGEYWLREVAGIDARAVMSLEAVHYPPALQPGDGLIVVSHSGGRTGFTREALDKAIAMDLPTVAVSRQGADLPDVGRVLETCPLEISQCHTVSYSTALMTVAQLATALAKQAGRNLPPGWMAQLQGVPDLMRQQFALEPTLQAWAQAIPTTCTIVVVGGGPHQATASELVLKVQEAASRPLHAMTVEQLLHGPMACLTEGDLVITTLPAGSSAEPRLAQAAAGLRELGIPLWGFYPGADVPVARQLGTNERSEWLAPFDTLVPLQLLAYHWALNVGLDPDWNRLEEPRHAAAKGHY